jgi:ATP-dependent exoDNAse (exonuclease V) beta subunit
MPEEQERFEPSNEQEAIIRHRGGHLQVIACAGSGKTESIARRIASLIADDNVDPSAIVARVRQLRCRRRTPSGRAAQS